MQSKYLPSSSPFQCLILTSLPPLQIHRDNGNGAGNIVRSMYFDFDHVSRELIAECGSLACGPVTLVV